MTRSSVLPKSIIKVIAGGSQELDDMLAAEEPLEIRISYGAFD